MWLPTACAAMLRGSVNSTGHRAERSEDSVHSIRVHSTLGATQTPA